MKSLPGTIAPDRTPFGAPTADLRTVAQNLRYHVVQMSHNAGTPHLGSALSCVDILVAAFWRTLSIDPHQPDSPERDRFILSKGHAAPALYTTLCARGFFPQSWLQEFASSGARLAEQPAPFCAPGIELATGSLGHGLPVAAGLALAGRIYKRAYRTVVVLGDGECNEGSVWEAAMFAAAQRLGRLSIVIDYNKWQATGRSDEILALPSLRSKWEAFGWDAIEVDGHDIEAVAQALAREQRDYGKPLAIVAHTVKGKGISFMEDDNNWHYRIPTAAEVERAEKELAA